MKRLVKWVTVAAVMLHTGYAQESDYAIKSSQLSGLKFRAIGPATTSGRIGDIAVNPNNFSQWYVAVASGGVWKTNNNGTTFKPIFDNEGSYSIGCVTIDPNNEHIVWVGTGENNNQRSVAYGDGVYKSTDGGASWKNMGLKNSEHIGMIKVDPRNSKVVYVAAYGPLWSAGGERGLYKTTDGGENWELILEIDEHTGVSEIHLDPRNPDVVYATAHQRRRRVYTYVSGGPSSTIYKSTDAGATFSKIEKGLPAGKMGRIGMAVAPSNPDILYAIVEAEDNKGGFFKSVNRGASWKKMNDYKTSGNYYQELVCDPTDANIVYAMDTYSHVTHDGGKTFTKVPEKNKHVDNHCLWINPNNTSHLIMGCDGGIYTSYDKANNWEYLPNLSVTQFYRVAVDNAKPFYNVYGGTQDNFSLGGPSRTNKDSGIDNYDWFVTNNGDGFESAIDPENPNIVYAQAQYGWLVRFDKLSGQKVGIQPQPPVGEAYRWNWDAPLIISPHNAQTLYFAANKLFKSTDRGNTWQTISPDLTRQIDRNKLKVMGRVQSIDAVMKNKSTTIYGNIVALSESPKKAGLIYVGTDDGLIQTTTNDGESWTKVGSFPGVPTNTYVNDVKASLHDENTVFAVFNNHKSGDFKPYVFKSTNQGKSWKSITGNLPERGSVYSLAQDHKNPNLLFVGTEFGVFFTIDGGENWVQLSNGIPTIAIRDIEIQREENDLVLASFGRGFFVLDDYSPLRSLTPELLKEEFHVFETRPGLVFTPNRKYGYGGAGFQGADFFLAENPPMGTTFTYYLKETISTQKQKRQKAESELIKANQDVVYPSKEEILAEAREEKPYLLFSIEDASGFELRRFTSTLSKGVQRITWDGRLASIAENSTAKEPLTNSSAAHFALPGTYYLTVYQMVNGELTSTLAEKHAFQLESLNQSVLPENTEEKFEFQRSLETFRREASGVNRYLSYIEHEVKAAKAAVRNTPNVSLEHLNTLRKLENQLTELKVTMRGNSILSSLEFETTPGIMSRMGLSVWNSYGNQQATTTIQRNDMEWAQQELAKVKTELNKLKSNFANLQNNLIKAGIPFPKHVLPE